MRLGGDGPELPRMGLGCMTMSWPGRDDEESLQELTAALDAGVTLLDTADRYGDGHDERLLARVLRDRRDEVVLATRVGFARSPDGRPVHGRPEHLHAAARASLARLGVDSVDLLIAQDVVPIPGSSRPAHLSENLGALGLTLSSDDLDELARIAPPGVAVGARKSPTGSELTAP